jgi:hypothetical protein
MNLFSASADIDEYCKYCVGTAFVLDADLPASDFLGVVCILQVYWGNLYQEIEGTEMPYSNKYRRSLLFQAVRVAVTVTFAMSPVYFNKKYCICAN